MFYFLGILQLQIVQSADNQLGIGGQNVLLEVLHSTEFSICRSIQTVVG
jgi:hypothetical protein